MCHDARISNLLKPKLGPLSLESRKRFDCSIADHTSVEARAAPSGEVLPGLHVLRRWHQDVGAVVGTAGVHGHILGLRLVPGLLVCRH